MGAAHLFVLPDRDHFQLGSLSHLLNAKAVGYQELPDWPSEAPDPSVRNVEVCACPLAACGGKWASQWPVLLQYIVRWAFLSMASSPVPYTCRFRWLPPHPVLPPVLP